MKKMIALLLALGMVLCLASCGGGNNSGGGSGGGTPAGSTPSSTTGSGSSGQASSAGGSEASGTPIVIKFASSNTLTDLMTVKNQKMCDYITEQSGGLITFEMYANNELGSMSDVTEMITRGADVMTWVGSDFFASVAPEMAVLNMQYSLSDQSQIATVENSDWFAEQCKLVSEGANTKILSWNWFTGYRHMMSNFPINSPDDIIGKKMRVVDNLALPAFATALECAPVVTTWNEVYTGLSSKLFDIAEGPLASLYSSSLFEVADHIALTNHLTSVNMVIMPQSLYDSLTPDQQALFEEASRMYGDLYSEEMLNSEEEYRTMLEEKGVTFTTPNVSAFQEKASRMYANIGYEETYNKLMEILG